MKNGTYYEGNFLNGVPEGKGIEHLSNGEEYYGDFLKGRRHGEGSSIE